MKRYQAIFLDRDGTMNDQDHLEYPWQFEPLPNLKTAVAKLRRTGALLLAFTNQACFARGKAGDYDFAAEFRDMGLDDWFICPHDDGDGCDCRKPGDGLLRQAAKKYGLDLSRCWVIGDRVTDLIPARKHGADTILVQTGRGARLLREGYPGFDFSEITYVAKDLEDAADRILAQIERSDT